MGSDKAPLVASVQRNGQVRLFTQRNLQKDTFRPLLKRWIRRGTQIYTDDYDIYHFLTSAGYQHQSVNHSQGEYARGEVHVNTTEAVFSLVRPYLAPFRGVSKVYLPLYAAAFEFRHNPPRRVSAGDRPPPAHR
ncbi:MAG: IS1595 family transposase [Anaerolineae bacterium]